MEYVKGVDLDELVQRTGPLSAARATYLIIQACGSLAEAHDHGMIHRDIKPNNIMVCKQGGEYDRIKVLDFGLVKSLEGENRDATVTAENAVTGTPLYMAPEILLNSTAASPRSDIYALGAVMYYLLSGSTLFPDREGMAVLVAQMSEEPQPLAELCPSLSAGLCGLVHRCLDKSPEGRPEDMRSLARELRAAVSSTWGEQDAESWWASHAELLQKDPKPEGASPSASEVAELGSAATRLVSRDEFTGDA
jgi:serine/threonine-protein kinase